MVLYDIIAHFLKNKQKTCNEIAVIGRTIVGNPRVRASAFAYSARVHSALSYEPYIIKYVGEGLGSI